MKCTERCPHYIRGMCFKKAHIKMVRENQACIVEAEKERKEWERELHDKKTHTDDTAAADHEEESSADYHEEDAGRQVKAYGDTVKAIQRL